MKNVYIIIMAGGAGTRFWPASTDQHPKQFLDILGVGKSLLQMTYERFLPLVDRDRIYIVTNQKYEELVNEQIPSLSSENLLLEPSRNNTGPCIAYAAYKIHALNPKANLVIAPSDHLILKEAVYLHILQEALTYTQENEAICTLGIQPGRPDTGYGYIHYEPEAHEGIHKVISFKEKPDLTTATRYVAEGQYLWNAGIFLFSSSTILAALQRYAPGISDLLALLPYNTPKEKAALSTHYPLTPDISIDYAVMEQADNVFTLPADIGWSDLGTWASLYGELSKDENENAIQAERALMEDASGNLIRMQPGKKVVVRGLHRMIIVDEPDALLIYPMANEQDIKQVTKAIS